MSNTAVKSFLTFGGSGLAISLGLFYLMSQLISGGADLNKSDDTENFIEFVRVHRESTVQERQRKLPKKPPEPKKPPMPQKLSLAANEPKTQQMKMDMPKLDTALKGSGPYLGPAGGGGNTGVAPIVRIEPQYPRKAAMQGIEGYVTVQFDVTETGAVTNVKVIDAQPKRIFNMSTKRAVLKWKYKPKIEDGKAVSMQGLKVKLDFKLDK